MKALGVMLFLVVATLGLLYLAFDFAKQNEQKTEMKHKQQDERLRKFQQKRDAAQPGSKEWQEADEEIQRMLK